MVEIDLIYSAVKSKFGLYETQKGRYEIGLHECEKGRHKYGKPVANFGVYFTLLNKESGQPIYDS